MRARRLSGYETAVFSWALLVGCGPREPAQTAAVTVPVAQAPEASTPRAADVPERSADGDRDGIRDSEDFCQTEAEDIDRCDDEDGCPEDDDHDGTPDASDECRHTPGPGRNKGCPLPPPPGTVRIQDSGDECLILNPVTFPLDSATLSEQGRAEVEAIVECMNIHTGLLLLEIRGYSGPEERTPELALERARAVERGLIARGVDGRRLRPVAADPLQAPRILGDTLQAVHFIVLRSLTCPAAFD